MRLMDPALVLWIPQNFLTLTESFTHLQVLHRLEKMALTKLLKILLFWDMLQTLNADLGITSTVITHEDLLVSKLFSDSYRFK
jgi:hypothetical protein